VLERLRNYINESGENKPKRLTKKQEYNLQLYDIRDTSQKNKIEDMEIIIDIINQDSKQLINSQSKTTVAKWYHITTTKEEPNELR